MEGVKDGMRACDNINQTVSADCSVFLMGVVLGLERDAGSGTGQSEVTVISSVYSIRCQLRGFKSHNNTVMPEL